MDARAILEEEARRSFRFFYEEANTDLKSSGYGLIRDKTSEIAKDVASIASVGFGLSAFVIGVERGWISYEEAYDRVKGTLHSFYHNVEHANGFFYHFVNMNTGKRNQHFHDCASIIDTSIFLNGALTAASYFGGDIEVYFQKIYQRVDWEKYYNREGNVYYMGYHEETGGFGRWDMYAEQMMQYFLGVASPTHSVPTIIYEGFERRLLTYKTYTFYNSPGGALFTHQFSHAWFDFRSYLDPDGIDWFENSIVASTASRAFSIDRKDNFKTYRKNAWGLTACEGPNGYIVPGTPPYYDEVKMQLDGTVPPCGAIGSIVFTPEAVKEAVHYYYHQHPNLFGKYGFFDAYNEDVDPTWYADIVIGIDKGISLLMIDNYLHGTTWKYYMQHPLINKAIDRLGFKKKEVRVES
ncbi:hypothetical protein HMI01_02990 [Halolactibacillus miurensis]|uniref:Glycoamylase-like domain-containing protein n=1 Tax=Halolactibacillus miurensis TaxID=306541 RepID=A0A1I6Q3T0_9BACI|nr:glucoamylase family protein [Halolactibacillus miurensis]GEM03311.1 hypothetical protein HMI01_02990 [Halolactibacillus miurensis]SFS47083.1 hypothetical protein SAMN05421668_10373 [Halolactibacillus miurensis]